MANFNLYLPKLLVYEGKYSNRAIDGETYKGIAQRSWPSWIGWKVIDTLASEENFPENLETNSVLQNAVHDFYKPNFWDKWLADQIENQSIAELVVDWEVNSGKYGIEGPQRALGLPADGIVGPQTIGDINNSDQQTVFTEIWQAHQVYFTECVANHPADEEFLKGWDNRLATHVFQA